MAEYRARARATVGASALENLPIDCLHVIGEFLETGMDTMADVSRALQNASAEDPKLIPAAKLKTLQELLKWQCRNDVAVPMKLG